ncbi:MAG TPA: pyrroline-5-carboxylate reductase [Chthoniobacterales bacterium]
MSVPSGLKFSFVGAGRMNRALVQGLLRVGVAAPGDIHVSTRTPEKLAALREEFGIVTAPDNASAAGAGDVVIFGVKPADAPAAIESCKSALKAKLVVSVMSGLAISTLREMTGASPRLVRAMPNVAALAGAGATAVAFDAKHTEVDVHAAELLFGSVGKVYPVKESLLDAVTGLSGSGPAYLYLVMEALAEGGVKAGLPRDLAQQLAVQTVLGSAQLAVETKQHPALLREMVTSPGGTTAAALAVLEDRGVRGAFIAAVEASARRAAELGSVAKK